MSLFSLQKKIQAWQDIAHSNNPTYDSEFKSGLEIALILLKQEIELIKSRVSELEKEYHLTNDEKREYAITEMLIELREVLGEKEK